MTGQMIEKIEGVLQKEKPDVVVVYGDTNSTLAGALAAVKLHIPVAHIEAGLRSFNMRMPEEVNRILTDRVSSKLFCPTETAVKNLTTEGYKSMPCEIIRSGDVMYDAALYYSEKSAGYNTLSRLNLREGDYFLSTIHRAENTDDLNNLREIISALNGLHSQLRVVLPLHPRTRKILEREKIKVDFTLLDPLGYFDMLNLIKGCRLVLTDSGGLQKEAYFFRKFCVTMRDQTEWVELVEGGYNQITGATSKKIVEAVQYFLNQSFTSESRLYGDGKASAKIVSHLTT